MEGATSPGSKESPSGRMDSARAAGVLLVPRLQLHPPSATTGKGARQFDTRSLNEENFIASIGVYTTPLHPTLHAPGDSSLLKSPLPPQCFPMVSTP